MTVIRRRQKREGRGLVTQSHAKQALPVLADAWHTRKQRQFGNKFVGRRCFTASGQNLRESSRHGGPVPGMMPGFPSNISRLVQASEFNINKRQVEACFQRKRAVNEARWKMLVYL